ncbi:MAG: AAA family ATPase, partial [Cyanobacteriota bacterium]
MTPPSLVEQLDLLIRSRTPILWIRTLEEERVEALLQQVARKLGGRTQWNWDFISGLQGAPGREGEAARNPMGALEVMASVPTDQGALLLLKDFHRFTEDAGICRRLRNLASRLRQGPHTLVITAPRWDLPGELQDSITTLELPLPDAPAIERLLASIAQASG